MAKKPQWVASAAYRTTTPKEWFQDVPLDIVYMWLKSGAWNKTAWNRWLKHNRIA